MKKYPILKRIEGVFAVLSVLYLVVAFVLIFTGVLLPKGEMDVGQAIGAVLVVLPFTIIGSVPFLVYAIVVFGVSRKALKTAVETGEIKKKTLWFVAISKTVLTALLVIVSVIFTSSLSVSSGVVFAVYALLWALSSATSFIALNKKKTEEIEQ
ncbi:MAG: hypothetical protein IJV80_00575 [Clostridia bacterium]|nr:hypothetical protein [Clostridia bacterium]